jgi:hypothetical protein
LTGLSAQQNSLDQAGFVRVNREIGRCADVVWMFPNHRSAVGSPAPS